VIGGPPNAGLIWGAVGVLAFSVLLPATVTMTVAQLDPASLARATPAGWAVLAISLFAGFFA